LITVAAYNTVKLFFVVKKMDLFPFTQKTLYSLLITALSFGLFYYWDFPFHAVINITLKSLLLSVLYLFLNYRFAISQEINEFVNKLIKK